MELHQGERGWLFSVCSLPTCASVLVLLFWRHGSTNYHFERLIFVLKRSHSRGRVRSPLSSTKSLFLNSTQMDGRYICTPLWICKSEQKWAKTLQTLTASQQKLLSVAEQSSKWQCWINLPGCLLSRIHTRYFRRDIQMKTACFGLVHLDQEEAQMLQKRRKSSDLGEHFCPIFQERSCMYLRHAQC